MIDRIVVHHQKIAEVCQLPDGHVMGPGAGPWPIIGVNCEMVADANCAADKVRLLR